MFHKYQKLFFKHCPVPNIKFQMCTTQIFYHCEQDEYYWYCRCRGCVCYSLLHTNFFHFNRVQSELRTKCPHCSAWNSWIEKKWQIYLCHFTDTNDWFMAHSSKMCHLCTDGKSRGRFSEFRATREWWQDCLFPNQSCISNRRRQ